MKVKPIALAIAIVFSQTSCVTTSTLKENKETLIGCAIGTGIGAFLGHYVAGRDGIGYGAALGAAIGCSVGYNAQKKREALDALAEAENLNIQYASISASSDSESQILINSTKSVITEADNEKYAAYKEVGMAATISSENDSMFASGSSVATNKAKIQFQKLAEIYKDSKANILITGHTDSSGSEELNQKLSEDRSRYVAQIFSEVGIATERLYFQGAGESQPIASNSSEKNKSQNRRVEIIEIEGKPEQLLSYASKQKSNIAYLSRRSQDKVTSVKTKTKTKKPSNPVNKTYSKNVNLSNISQSEVDKLVKPVELKVASVDFGGKPMTEVSSEYVRLVGERKENSFALFSKAYASEISSLNCVAEGPRVDGKIKSLATGEDYQRGNYNTADYLPGMNGTVWVEKVNGHYVGITPVAIINDGGTAVASPKIKVWKNYENSKASSTPDYEIGSSVETYYGETGLLYRVFSKDSDSPVRCMDVVMPIDRSAKAIAGKLYYENNKTVYEVDFEPKLL